MTKCYWICIILIHECNFGYKPDGLLVMHEGFLQFPLLLQDTGQIRVGCCKFWENLMFKKKLPMIMNETNLPGKTNH